MRIGIDYRFSGVTGIGRFTHDLVTSLVAVAGNTHEFILVTGVNQDEPELGHISVTKSLTGTRSIANQFEINRLIKESGIQAFLSPHFIFPIFPSGATRVVVIHDLTPIIMTSQFSVAARSYMRFFVSFALRVADAVIAISSNTRQDIQRYFGRAADRNTHVIPNGFDWRRFAKRASQHEISESMRRYKLSSRYVLFVGNLKKHKNLPYCLDTLRLLNDGHQSRYDLVVVGPDDKGVWPVMAADYPDLSGHIHHLGIIPDSDLVTLYQSAEALIFPSEYEGFGYPILEAMASGLPVLCSNRASIPEVASDAAWYIDISDARTCADALVQLETDEVRRNSMISSGFLRSKQFEWELTASRYLDTLLSVTREVS